MKLEHVKPLITEEISNRPLSIEGNLPEWLKGSLIRNSAIPLYQNGIQVSHPFDGLAMLYGFEFKNGKIFYSNRFIKSNDYEKVTKEGKMFSGFSSSSDTETYSKDKKPEIQNTSVNVFNYHNTPVALTEIPLPTIFDLQTLNTVSSFDYKDELPKDLCWECAHPHFDHDSQNIFNFLVTFFPKTEYVLYQIPKGSSSRHLIARIPVQSPSYMHSFAVTEHYLILTEFPLLIDSKKLREGNSFLKSLELGSKSEDSFFSYR